jgi:hypothetical protein
MSNTPTPLPEISQKIKALEKNDIQSAIEKGKLLNEAHEQIQHGDYLTWLKTEFGWSHGTASNLRNVYDLTQNHKIYDFAKLDISISALYTVARIMNHGAPADMIAVGVAVITAAQTGRVSFQTAQGIIKNALAKSIEDKDRTGAAASAASATADKLSKLMSGPPARDGGSTADDAKRVRRATEDREGAHVVKGKAVKLAGIIKTIDLMEENDPVWTEVPLDVLHRVRLMIDVIDDQRHEGKTKSAVDRKADRAADRPTTKH